MIQGLTFPSSLVIGFNLTTEGLAKALGIDRARGTPV
jgi:hypothetical protein